MAQTFSASNYQDYGFHNAQACHMHDRILPAFAQMAGNVKGKRALDVGCGNGYICGEIVRLGGHAIGIDLSPSGIEVARKAYPGARFEIAAADAGLLEKLAETPFDLVVSTEVVEHLYSPREWARGCLLALRPGGRLICTTPYHGYLKNLVIAALGKWDSHANPLWDGGHIKLWSRRTLGQLLTEAGFCNLQFRGIGRFPYLWMTMMFSAERPSTEKQKSES